jgi:large conductance mechanosensitive channel
MAKGLGKEFLNFINRGNVVDLAVAVIIGAAFTKVVQAVVDLFTTAALNPAMGELGIDELSSWPAGNLLVALLNFVVVAAVVFVVVKSVERLKHRTAKADPAAESQKKLAEAVDRLSAALEERRL